MTINQFTSSLQIDMLLLTNPKGPSIYDVHTEKEEGQAQVDACGRGGGSSPMCMYVCMYLRLLANMACQNASIYKKSTGIKLLCRNSRLPTIAYKCI